MTKPTIYHIPICPFCQRIEILLELKGMRDRMGFEVVDITKPRSEELLAKTGGSTSLPILETEEGNVIKESLVILRYAEQRFADVPVAREDAWEQALENMIISMASDFVVRGYRHVMNQDLARREEHYEKMLAIYADLNDFLTLHAPERDFLFEDFGMAEVVYTPFFQRFWFLEYYEDFELPTDGRFDRVIRWREACLDSPAAQQTTREEIIKLYYDYALGVGNGALPEGRERSTFVFEPHWRERPWPPRDKYGTSASDEELGLV